jgi:hypothetical protein
VIFLKDDFLLIGIINRYDKVTRLTCEADPYWRVRSWEIFSSDAVR